MLSSIAFNSFFAPISNTLSISLVNNFLLKSKSISFGALRFSSGSSVAYVYESKNKKTMYILTIYSLIKRGGNGRKTIEIIKNYAAKRRYRIITTTSIRSPFKKNADRFYEQCGFKHVGNDDKHSYYVIENLKRTES